MKTKNSLGGKLLQILIKLRVLIIYHYSKRYEPDPCACLARKSRRVSLHSVLLKVLLLLRYKFTQIK